MHWSTAADQPKSYESCLTVVTLIEGCPRKRNSAKQALSVPNVLGQGVVGDGGAIAVTSLGDAQVHAYEACT